MSTAILTIKNLTFERDQIDLFRNINVEYAARDIVHVVGSNGSGKTTLLNILANQIDHHLGDITFSPDASSPSIINRKLEFLSQLLFIGHLPGVNLSLTVAENLQWYFDLHGTKAKNTILNSADLKNTEVSHQQIIDALNNVSLAGYEHTRCHDLSAGQKRRAALARLYISQAPLWLLDEPFTSLDVQGVKNIEKRIEAHAKNGGIILITSHQEPNIEGLKCLNLMDYKLQNSSLADSSLADSSVDNGASCAD